MLAVLHPSSRAYLDPWSGQIFGEGGVEKTLHATKLTDKSVTKGGVIMAKLGNETAK